MKFIHRILISFTVSLILIIIIKNSLTENELELFLEFIKWVNRWLRLSFI